MKTLIFANFQILQTVEYLIEILIFVVIHNEAKFTIIPKRHNQQTLIFGNFQILKTVKYGSFDMFDAHTEVRFSLIPRTEGEAFLRSLENETF